MFTAEEIEECDIFPKKVTLACSFKVAIYTFVMSMACVLMYSFYSGKDFVSILTLESLHYGRESYFTERLAEIDSKYSYDQTDKYHMNYSEVENSTEKFIKDYVNANLPCIIRNGTTHLLLESLVKNNFDKILQGSDFKIPVETRQDPYMAFFKNGFTYQNLTYHQFIQEATNKDRTHNYLINDLSLIDPLLILDNKEILGTYILNELKQKIFFKYLKFLPNNGLTFSEGYDEMVIPGHNEHSENVICQLKGEVDLMLVPPSQRKHLYPFKRAYGPPNYSAVPLFKADYGRFPNYKMANRIHVTLTESDCLYVPSFWWYSVKSREHVNYNYITLKFYASSRWVEQIVEGLEFDDF